jgi:hypothetical protein
MHGPRRWALRVKWLAADTLGVARGLARALRQVRRVDDRIGIGLLEGAACAVAGEPNPYRIRLVNDGPEARAVRLELHGEGAATTTISCALEPRTARDLFLVTDWGQRFDVTAEPPAAPDDQLVHPPGADTCRLTATLWAGPELVDRLMIVQPLLR